MVVVARRRDAYNAHTSGHREGAAASALAPRGAYMHIHTAAKCHTHPGPRIYTRTQQRHATATALHHRAVRPRRTRRRKGRTKGEEEEEERSEGGTGYAENGDPTEREREERRTWKLCSGVKLGCLPFVGLHTKFILS